MFLVLRIMQKIDVVLCLAHKIPYRNGKCWLFLYDFLHAFKYISTINSEKKIIKKFRCDPKT